MFLGRQLKRTPFNLRLGSSIAITYVTRYPFNLFFDGPVNYVRHHQKYGSTVNPVFLDVVCCVIIHNLQRHLLNVLKEITMEILWDFHKSGLLKKGW